MTSATNITPRPHQRRCTAPATQSFRFLTLTPQGRLNISPPHYCTLYSILTPRHHYTSPLPDYTVDCHRLLPIPTPLRQLHHPESTPCRTLLSTRRLSRRLGKSRPYGTSAQSRPADAPSCIAASMVSWKSSECHLASVRLHSTSPHFPRLAPGWRKIFVIDLVLIMPFTQHYRAQGEYHHRRPRCLG